MAVLGALSSMLPNLGQEIPDPNLLVLPAKAKKSFASKTTKRCIGKKTKSLKERLEEERRQDEADFSKRRCLH